MTRVTQLIHDAGKYLLISVYPLPTHPTHNFTHNNGGNLETLPGWPKKLQHNRPARSAGQWQYGCESLVTWMKFVIWACQHHHKYTLFQISVTWKTVTWTYWCFHKMASITILQMAFSFIDDICKIVFLYMNCIYIQIVLNFIPNGPIDKKLSMGLIMDCHRTDVKPLS